MRAAPCLALKLEASTAPIGSLNDLIARARATAAGPLNTVGVPFYVSDICKLGAFRSIAFEGNSNGTDHGVVPLPDNVEPAALAPRASRPSVSMMRRDGGRGFVRFKRQIKEARGCSRGLLVIDRFSAFKTQRE